MHSDDEFLPQRRKFISSPLTLGLASAGVLGLASARADVDPSSTESGLAYPAELSLALLRDYQTAKASSYDRTGGNADALQNRTGRHAALDGCPRPRDGQPHLVHHFRPRSAALEEADPAHVLGWRIRA